MPQALEQVEGDGAGDEHQEACGAERGEDASAPLVLDVRRRAGGDFQLVMAFARLEAVVEVLVGGAAPREDEDDAFARRGFENVGAWILGRNMFAHSRGPWTDDGWKGWWGPNPPYHVPVFVLTHYPREPLEMEGGTTFYFVTEGIHAALDRAKAAAGGKDVRLGGGVATVREFLDADLVDTMHVAVAPIEIGRGERLWTSPDELLDRFHLESVPSASGVTHHIFWRR